MASLMPMCSRPSTLSVALGHVAGAGGLVLSPPSGARWLPHHRLCGLPPPVEGPFHAGVRPDPCLPVREPRVRATRRRVLWPPPTWEGMAALVPSYAQRFARLGHYHPAKALGEDRVGPDVYHSWPQEMAMLVHPVAIKALWRGAPPVQWLGGMLHEL